MRSRRRRSSTPISSGRTRRPGSRRWSARQLRASAPLKRAVHSGSQRTRRGQVGERIPAQPCEFPLNQADRGDRARTCDLRFWRPPLYQLSYAPLSSEIVVGLLSDGEYACGRAAAAGARAPFPLSRDVLPRDRSGCRAGSVEDAGSCRDRAGRGGARSVARHDVVARSQRSLEEIAGSRRILPL